MENKETFKMTYSAQQQEEIQQIRDKYLPKEPTKLEQLRALDASATQKATMLSIMVGVIGSLLLGLGMSLVMTEFGQLLGNAAFPVGVAVGVIGMIVVAAAYPLYHIVLKKQRAKIAPDILRLSEELMQ